MKKLTDLAEFKNAKKYKQIIDDLDKVLHIFDLTQRSLMFFKKYKNVQEVISIVETNGTLMNLYKKKYQQELDKSKK